MKLNRTGSNWTELERNKINENWTQLEKKQNQISKSIDDLVLESGGDSNLEVVQARGGRRVLNERLDEMDSELITKADKESLAMIADSKRDKSTEISMSDLDQEVREAFTGGAVAVVGEDSVGNINLRDRSVTNNKLDIDVAIKAPWLNSDAGDDLDYVWEEGNYYVESSVKNNPFNDLSILIVKRFKTQYYADFAMVKQTIIKSSRSSDIEIMYRIIRIIESTGEISWKKDWKGFVNEKIGRDSLDRLYNNAFPWLNKPEDDLNYVWETGTYMINENVKNNPANDIALLEVVEAKTVPTGELSWVKQVVTLARNGIDPVEYYRVLQVNTVQDKINWLHDWRTGNNNNENSYLGTSWVALGTSMTARGEYARYVANQLGLKLDNRGVGSGGITSYASKGNTTMQAVESIENFKGITSIELGPNDWRGCPLGELGDREDDTWYGAVDKVCRTISIRTTARPFLITSTTAAFQLNADFDETKRRDLYETNSHGFKYIDYVNAVKEVAQHYSIPVCDVFGESGLGSYHQNNQTLSDHIHLTDLGGRIYGNHIINFLKHEFTPFPFEYENPLSTE